jgi:hypothetical protein
MERQLIIKLRPALPVHLPVVMEIVGEAAARLVAKGINQWPAPPNEHWWRRMERQIANGEIYLASFSVVSSRTMITPLRFMKSSYKSRSYTAHFVNREKKSCSPVSVCRRM